MRNNCKLLYPEDQFKHYFVIVLSVIVTFVALAL